MKYFNKLFNIDCEIPESGYPKILLTKCKNCATIIKSEIVFRQEEVKRIMTNSFDYQMINIDSPMNKKGIKLSYCNCL